MGRSCRACVCASTSYVHTVCLHPQFSVSRCDTISNITRPDRGILPSMHTTRKKQNQPQAVHFSAIIRQRFKGIGALARSALSHARTWSASPGKSGKYVASFRECQQFSDLSSIGGLCGTFPAHLHVATVRSGTSPSEKPVVQGVVLTDSLKYRNQALHVHVWARRQPTSVSSTVDRVDQAPKMKRSWKRACGALKNAALLTKHSLDAEEHERYVERVLARFVDMRLRETWNVSDSRANRDGGEGIWPSRRSSRARDRREEWAAELRTDRKDRTGLLTSGAWPEKTLGSRRVATSFQRTRHSGTQGRGMRHMNAVVGTGMFNSPSHRLVVVLNTGDT